MYLIALIAIASVDAPVCVWLCTSVKVSSLVRMAASESAMRATLRRMRRIETETDTEGKTGTETDTETDTTTKAEDDADGEG